MNVRAYSSPDVFLSDASQIIKGYEIECNITHKNIENARSSCDSGVLLAAVMDGADTLMVATRTPGFPVVIHTREMKACDRTAEVFAKYLVQTGLREEQFMGDDRALPCYAKAYANAVSKRQCVSDSLILYRLDRIIDANRAKGCLRAVEERDMPFLPFWLGHFMPACGKGVFSLDSGITTARRLIDSARGFVWEDGVAVSFASSLRETPYYRVIGNVYTPTYYQNKGYSTACVSALSRRILDSGVPAILYANAKNPVSNHVYAKIGFRPLANVSIYSFGD